MKRIDKILSHDLFISNLRKNNMAEADRCFCRHNIEHFLDVARIAVIINLEENMGVDKELIYAAALLHDIGRHVQYQEGTPHEEESSRIAPKILQECGFDDCETGVITDAILNHRCAESAGERNLRGLLYRGDKASRACFACEAQSLCNWKQEKKNLIINY